MSEAKELPKLAQLRDVDRVLSEAEYYHACIGRHPRTTYPPRQIIFVIEGHADGVRIPWQSAIDKVVAVNPGARLRLAGSRQHARWLSDGVGPRLRILEQCNWDGRSEIGAEFIYSTRLSLEEGPTAELIIAGAGSTSKVIFRVLHAAMDGIGVMHFFQELFRALRGETLLGTNAAFSDTDLMLHVDAQLCTELSFQPASLTGMAQGSEVGHTWRRISLKHSRNLLARTALAVGEFSRGKSDTPVRIGVPVNLRRHVPGLLSTMNFSNMILVDVAEKDTVSDIKYRMQDMLNRNVDAGFPKFGSLVRYLPFSWLDWISTSTEKNYTSPRILETAVLSNLGNYSRDDLACNGFRPVCLYGIPIESNCFSIAFGLQGRVELTIGMARVFASGGRLDELVEFLERRLEAGAV